MEGKVAGDEGVEDDSGGNASTTLENHDHRTQKCSFCAVVLKRE